jgi:AcrR family transcriptional regulator
MKTANYFNRRYMVNKEVFRKNIIITAGQTFSRFGFKKTTMEEVARALKIGKSSIYYYFSSKEEIFENVVLYEANILRNELTTAIKSEESPIKKMEKYIFVRMKAFEKLSNYYNAVFDNNLDHFEFIERLRERYDMEEIAILRLILYDGVRKKVFNVKNSEYTALAIQTTLKGLEVPLFWKKRKVNIDHRMKAILDVLFYGLVLK